MTLGWTVDEWHSAQVAGSGRQRLLDLVSKFDSENSKTHIWIHVATASEINAQWDELEKLNKDLPLWGVPFAVKDNIDVKGMPTTAACPAFEYDPTENAFIVEKLRNAGAIVVGKTNLDQFATGLVGVRSPYGIATNSFSADRVPGGSSSGSAAIVGLGGVPFSLGTDTAGSGRVPAALNNLIGVKPTLGLWSTRGVVPACKSLDTATVFTLGLHDAQLILSIASGYDPKCGYSRKAPETVPQSLPYRPLIGVPATTQFFGDDQNKSLYKNAITHLSQFADVQEVDCTSLYKLAKLLYEGPWVVERYHAVQDYISHPELMDPTVYKVIKQAENYSAVDVYDKEYLRQEIQRQAGELFKQVDLLCFPTCPLNPTVASVLSEPVKVNSQQGEYTNFVNLADLAALAVPSGFREDGLPQGITFMGPAWSDYKLFNIAKRFLPEARPVGALSGERQLDSLYGPRELGLLPETIPLAVAGAHLSGMPLNWQLRKVHATLSFKTKTAPKYSVLALDTTPPKPGVVSGHSSIDVEVWNVPAKLLGEFLTWIPSPLALGQIELADGSKVTGFVCTTSDGKDITNIGWRSYVASKGGKPFTKVLVANRGEIAVRLIRTLKSLGIKSVAIYSESDRYAQHVKDADEAVDLHGVKPATTYLSFRKIIDACKATGAEAILPGYGFLSENPDFADLCEQEGIIFVGPSGAAMRALGLKHSARKIAREAGVPLVPGSDLVNSTEEALAEAKKIGFPVMLKSTAGGGGIGLQKVETEAELPNAFSTVKHQAQQYFGDAGVFVEAFVSNARHVEVQVLGDGKGGAASLGQRDCSLQRRNQKIIEETPAPGIRPELAQSMEAASRSLVSMLKYKCAGTVEYIYDAKREAFYFLEVNARLQVEHPITEEVFGVDLVELMLRLAADQNIFPLNLEPKGWAMEARLYAENPVRGFLPSPGQISGITWPKDSRIDGWVSKGTIVSSEYDPTLAKLIVKAPTREQCLKKLERSLDETRIEGIITNIDYIRQIVSSSMFVDASMHTKILDTWSYTPHAIEVLQPGGLSSIQDWPGRLGLWHVGVPPSGPMDDFAHRAANYAVGNDPRAPAIECTLTGPTLKFLAPATVAITGGEAPATLDAKSVELWKPFTVSPNSTLTIGKLSKGCRVYIAVRGGIDVPEYLGSRSTFAMGLIGGYNGRTLKFGDVLNIAQSELPTCQIPPPIRDPSPFVNPPSYESKWEVAAVCGPHGEGFFTPEYLKEFFSAEWKVHYNSNRFGVRLVGPSPTWARVDGGEAGLHPSNAHDYVYSMGAVNFTGDEPVVLTCDGPSLGGFLCAAVVVSSELWKFGQMRPGDTVKLVPVSFDQAHRLNHAVESILQGESHEHLPKTREMTDPILYQDDRVCFRQAGDKYVLVEFGENVLDIDVRYQIHRLIEILSGESQVVEQSPGVRSVLVEFRGSQSSLVEKLKSAESRISTTHDWKVSSRVIRLPLAFEDSKTLSAVTRYSETVRSEAPWLPNNVDFIARINGVPRQVVRNVLYSGKFLVLGLGDVYLGAPCAVPLDPRQRLLGTKYNPSRSWTPNGTVGLGGMYMCIYTMESPGGYQLVGRTIPTWDKLCLNSHSTAGEPWLLRPFDVVEFFPCSEAELETFVEQFNHGEYAADVHDYVFDATNYHQFLDENSESIAAHEKNLSEHVDEFGKVVAASNRLVSSQSNATPVDTNQFSESAELVYSEVMGRFWKSQVSEGDLVEKGQPLVVLEAMKTEMTIAAPIQGRAVKIVHQNGDMVDTGDLVAVIEPIN